MSTFSEVLENDVLGAASPSRKLFLADSTSAIDVRRTTKDLVHTVAVGSGDMLPYGDHTHTANKSYRIVIDSAGDEQTATFGWSDDGGATFQQTNVACSALHRTELQNLLTVVFAFGTYEVGDQWDFTAIGTANQLYDLKVDTTNSIVYVGRRLYVANDPNFRLDLDPSGFPSIFFDATTYVGYDRASDALYIRVEGNTIVAMTNAAMDVNYPLNAQSTMSVAGQLTAFSPIRMISIATPSTPASGYGLLYQNTDRPYWLDDNGLNSRIPLAAAAETISGAWTFSAAATAITVTNNILCAALVCTSLLVTQVYDAALGARIGIATSSPHVNMTTDATITGYLRVGSGAAPSNTTAGDLTATRAVLGTNAAMPASTSIYLNAAVKVNGNIGFYNTAPVAQPTVVNLTNNVTAGGVDGTIADYSSLTIYATDAAAIRNNLYQLARGLKQVEDALHTLGLAA